MPERIQLSRKKGWRMPPNTVSVARPGPFGNPYKVGEHGDADRCVMLFRQALNGLIDNTKPPAPQVAEVIRLQSAYRDRGHTLAGKNLACWCPLDRPCHADVLLELVNSPTPEGSRNP